MLTKLFGKKTNKKLLDKPFEWSVKHMDIK